MLLLNSLFRHKHIFRHKILRPRLFEYKLAKNKIGKNIKYLQQNFYRNYRSQVCICLKKLGLNY